MVKEPQVSTPTTVGIPPCRPVNEPTVHSRKPTDLRIDGRPQVGALKRTHTHRVANSIEPYNHKNRQIRAFKGTHKFAQSREPTNLRIQGNPQICAFKGTNRFAQCWEATGWHTHRNPESCQLNRAIQPYEPTEPCIQGNPQLYAFKGTHNFAHSREHTNLRIQGNPQS